MVNRSIEMKNPNTPMEQEGEPKEIFFSQRLQLPGGECPVKTMMAESSSMATEIPSTPTNSGC